jgi:DNA polymerase-1
MTTPQAPRLFLIDAFGLIFRAFYGRARSSVPSMRTSAGVPTEAVYVFLNMLRKLLSDHKPDYVAVVWEGEGPTFRDDAFEHYKANREAMPEDLATQLPLIKRLLEALNTPVIKADGFEADDSIGALAKQAAEHDIDVFVVSSDKDLMQLVGGRVWFLNPTKNDMIYDDAGVKEFMGVEPKQVIDLLALKGDAVDNIPGAPGIGEKGALQLIEAYGSVEGAMAHADEVKRKTYRESLQNHQEQILLSKKLATIDVDTPVILDLDELRVGEPNTDALRDLYRDLEFRSLLSALETPKQEESSTTSRVFESGEEFATWLSQQKTSPISLWADLAPTEDLFDASITFCATVGAAVQLRSADREAARSFLEDPTQPKRVHDAKSTIHALRKVGIELRGVVDDTMMAAFLADSSRTDYSLSKTAARILAVEPDGDPCRAVDLVHRIGEALAPDLDKMELREAYETIELPLSRVLADMEDAGILLDRSILDALSKKLQHKIEDIEIEVYKLAGREFNLNSPKQLGEVLFDELELPAPARRGKTKARSTAAAVLEGLAVEYPIAQRLLDYREYAKLKSTYLDALPALANPETGRIHTTFNPTGSATGRLSSVNPNLQNIPIRTEMGREIRTAFIAPAGMSLVGADYSQIELRVLAHVSGDKALQDAFQKGEDVHTRTAAEVFGIPPMMIGAEERRRAKAVNFGIVYGLSPFGLSNQLGIPMNEAKAYIEAYFELYKGVKKYMDRTIVEARKRGYVATIFGRRRPIPDLDSRNPTARGFAERTAINSPIQGAAADLIKLAMIHLDEKLRAEGLRARMILQVHDELLFEVPTEEVEALSALVKRQMEQVYKLDVPLIADVHDGSNWRDLK